MERLRLGCSRLPPRRCGVAGVVDVTSYLVNFAYNFNSEGTSSPNLGAGLGIAEVDFDNFGVAPIPAVLDDSDSVLGDQLIAGVDGRLGSSRRLFADYRVQAADDLEVTVSPAAGSVGSEIDLETQSFNVGARYRF